MKILIDECLPRKLKNELPDHEVQTVPEAGGQARRTATSLVLILIRKVLGIVESPPSGKKWGTNFFCI